MPLRRAKRALQIATAGLVVLFAVPAIFSAVVLPYRYWDSLAFGSWSRSIAEGAGIWDNGVALSLQRPLFYVEQGLAWRFLGDGEWIGRLVSLSYAAILVLAVWLLARQLTTDARAGALLSPLAVLTVLASSALAANAAAGMTDVPVAAMVASTGAAAWGAKPGYPRVAGVAALAAAAALAKPSAFIGLAGLALALIVLRRLDAVRALAGIVAGSGLALAYAAWQAARIDYRLSDFLTAGNDAFWRERGAAARWDALARAEWLGSGLRLVVLYGLVYALARVAGARARLALCLAAGIALGWSIAGPVVADGGTPYPFDGSMVGIAAWLVLAAAMVAAPVRAEDDPVPRRVHCALVVWLVPMAIAWWWQRADETRHLAPAWAPLALLTAVGVTALALALARARPAAALVPAAALAALVLANVTSIDGLGRGGWNDLLGLGPSGWTDRAERENFAYGPFSYELNAARENVDEDDRLVSSNGRLAYFFPGRVEIAYPRSCSELEGARFFSFLRSGESVHFAQQAGQALDPFAWLQCSDPPVTLVSEHEGIYAAFVVGGPPAREPPPTECRIAPGPGQDVDAVFGRHLTYAQAKSLRERAFAIGYTGGLRLERTGCSTFRVVVTGLPEDQGTQAQFRRDAKRNGFDVSLAPAVRFPEAPTDISAVP